MFDLIGRRGARASDSGEIERDLADLCRRHGVAPELVQNSSDIDDLIERVIRDYEVRSAQPHDAPRSGIESTEPAGYDLRAMVAFACRASLLRERAAAATFISRGDAAARVERLEELLATVGALIHKINNPLTALVGRAQLLRMQGELPPRVVRGAEVIEDSSRRIAELTRELGSRVKEARRMAGGGAADGADVATPSGEPSR